MIIRCLKWTPDGGRRDHAWWEKARLKSMCQRFSHRVACSCIGKYGGSQYSLSAHYSTVILGSKNVNVVNETTPDMGLKVWDDDDTLQKGFLQYHSNLAAYSMSWHCQVEFLLTAAATLAKLQPCTRTNCRLMPIDLWLDVWQPQQTWCSDSR